jgi:hypothetical protein
VKLPTGELGLDFEKFLTEPEVDEGVFNVFHSVFTGTIPADCQNIVEITWRDRVPKE